MAKLYVSNEEEKSVAETAVHIIMEIVQEEANSSHDYSPEEMEAALQLASNITVVQGASQLDTALMSEIGKAYKEKYNQAQAQGDTDTMNKMHGAMYAVKRIMEMVSEPKY